jgi:hypothetical protein
MLRPWNPMRKEIEGLLRTTELEFAQKYNRNPKITLHKYLDKYVFTDLHEVFFLSFSASTTRVDLKVKGYPRNESDSTAILDSNTDPKTIAGEQQIHLCSRLLA